MAEETNEKPNEKTEPVEKFEAKMPKESPLFDCLAVTNVQVYPFREGASFGKIKALASIVLNDQMQMRGLRVVDGINGLFVGYPNDPFYKGDEFHYVCFPITRRLRDHIENCVLERYQQCVSG